MLLIKEEKQIAREISRIRKLGKEINFVPTMGNLHAGHMSLVRKAKRNGAICLVSIFVNPLQFNEQIDFKNYPRSIKDDRMLLSINKTDILFLPNPSFISKNISNYQLGKESKKLCGIDRGGHFLGVASVILKFLKLIQPDNLYLGEKDFQQTIIINNLINDFNFKTRIKLLPTVRDSKGIAISSRNQFLKKKSTIQLLPETLKQIKREVENGGFRISKINSIKKILETKGIEKVNYLDILKEKDLAYLNNKCSKVRIFISATISGIRLIDNMGIDKDVMLSNGKVRICCKV